MKRGKCKLPTSSSTTSANPAANSANSSVLNPAATTEAVMPSTTEQTDSETTELTRKTTEMTEMTENTEMTDMTDMKPTETAEIAEMTVMMEVKVECTEATASKAKASNNSEHATNNNIQNTLERKTDNHIPENGRSRHKDQEASGALMALPCPPQDPRVLANPTPSHTTPNKTLNKAPNSPNSFSFVSPKVGSEIKGVWGSIERFLLVRTPPSVDIPAQGGEKVRRRLPHR